MKLIPIVLTLFIALICSGCGDSALDDSRWSGDNCVEQGQLTVCSVDKPSGQTCEVTREVRNYTLDTVTQTCNTESTEMDCNEKSSNNSGNVCRVPMGDGTYCVAILPDGKSDRRQDNIQCPNGGDTTEAKKIVKAKG